MPSRLHRPLNKSQLKKVVDAAIASESVKRLTEALIEATRAKNVESIRALLDAGADPNHVVDGMPALGWAGATYSPKKGGVVVVQMLLDAGADPTFPGLCGFVPPEAIQLLVKAGADPSRMDDGSGAVAWALGIFVDQPETALALLEAGANPNLPDAQGMPPLIGAVDCGAKKVFDSLLQRGADPLAIDRSGRSALRHAVEGLCGGTQAAASQRPSLLAMIRRLRQYLPAQPEDLFLSALALDDVDSLHLFLKAGLPPDTRLQGGIGRIGFADAAQVLPPDAPRIFGIFLAIPDQDRVDYVVQGCSLLTWAVRLNAVQCATALLEAGADPNARNAAGVSAADLGVGRDTAYRMRKLIGTYGVNFRKHVPGTREFASDTSLEQRLASPTTRCERLGLDAECIQEQLRFGLADACKDTNIEGNFSCCTRLWDYIGDAFLAEEPQHIPVLADRMKAEAQRFFFGPCRDEPWRPFPDRPRDASNLTDPWPEDLPPALAAAMLVGDWEHVDRLAAFPDPRLERNPPGDSMYNQPYYAWPLLILWSQAYRSISPDPTYEADVRRQSPRHAKRFHLLLDAILAIRDSNERDARKAFLTYLSYHRKSERSGYGRSDGAFYRPCPYTTVMALWSRRRNVDLALGPSQRDLVVLPSPMSVHGTRA